MWSRVISFDGAADVYEGVGDRHNAASLQETGGVGQAEQFIPELCWL
jgi:hypothetical protein